MRNEEIKINEVYYTRVSGELVRVKVIGETKGYKQRRAWRIIREDNGRPLEDRDAQALHLTSNPLKEREERGKATRQLKTDKLRGFSGSRTERVAPQRETYIPGNDQRCEAPETIVHDCGPEPDLDLDAETVDDPNYPGSILDSGD